MKLSKAAVFFDNDSVYDGYTGDYLFKAQFSSFEGADPDGNFQRRRTVSVGPSILFPTRRVVKVENDRWILGDLMTDTFFDKTIRRNASAKYVTDSFELCSPRQAALAQAGMQLYGFTKYLKDTVNLTTDGDYDPFYNVTVARSEPIVDGYFFRNSDRLLRIRTYLRDVDGFYTCGCDEVTNATVAVSYDGAYDPISDTFAVGSSTTGLLIDYYKVYQYQTQSDPKNVAGDMALVLSDTINIRPGSDLSIAGNPWRVFSIVNQHDAQILHVRRA